VGHPTPVPSACDLARVVAGDFAGLGLYSWASLRSLMLGDFPVFLFCPSKTIDCWSVLNLDDSR